MTRLSRSAFTLAVVVSSLSWAEIPTGNAPAPQVMAEFRRIEAAQARIQVDTLRMEYQEAARSKPADVLLRVFIAWCAMPSDDTWNQLKGYASTSPENPWLHYGMGRVYLAWKMKDKAQAEFDGILAKDPKFYPAMIGLGDLARQKEDWETAERLYKASLAVSEDPSAWAGLGHMALARGQGDAAREAFKKSIALHPDQPGVLDRLLKACIEAKDPQLPEVAKALAELQPRHREARRILADAAFAAGQKPEAAEHYEKLFRLGDPDVATALRLADLYKELGKPDDEERVVELVARLDKVSAAPTLRLAELAVAKLSLLPPDALLLARTDRPSADPALRAAELEAMKKRLVKAAVLADPTPEAIEAWLVTAKKSVGRPEVLWNQALERDPTLAIAHFKLGEFKREAKLLHLAADSFLAAGALEGAGAAEGRAEAEKLLKTFDLPKVPFAGGVDAINVKVSITLDKLFQKRVLQRPGMYGILRIRVRVDATGAVKGVDVVEDTLGDPVLVAHAYYVLKQATWPKQKRDPVFEFELGKKKGK